ncbi:MAG: TetR family transcriptional regulator [Bacteroidales bacterium]|nr:TetR family transcriptional regulator [Bacteroidales bacterium]
MTELNKDTEGKILEAAQDVFTEKGMSGTRMQEIADKAGINKSLLHYYYRSKEKLFGAVFKTVLTRFLPKTLKILNAEMPLFEKIEKFVDAYLDIIMKNPSAPIFLINEMHKNPNGIASIMINAFTDMGFHPAERFAVDVETAKKQGLIRDDVNAKHLFVNMMSICIFPVAARPLLQRIGFDNNSKDYDLFLSVRKTEVRNFIINSIKK